MEWNYQTFSHFKTGNWGSHTLNSSSDNDSDFHQTSTQESSGMGIVTTCRMCPQILTAPCGAHSVVPTSQMAKSRLVEAKSSSQARKWGSGS